MSLGGAVYSYSYEYAVRSAINSGITFVVAMGNDGSNVKKYPAAFNIPGLIAVEASNKAGKRAGFSTYGSWGDIMAPGTDIISSVPGNVYETWDGTSMATPVVSGVCALYMSAYGNPGPAKMEKIIKKAKTKGVIDASKLFSADKASPIISSYGMMNKKMAYDSYIDIRKAAGASNDAMIIYTLDGKEPQVKNGVVTVGEVYNGSLYANTGYGFKPGKKMTIKAVCISGMGVKSKTAKLTFTLQYKAPSSVTITTQTDHLVSGRSIKMGAKVYPTDAANQSVTWSIQSHSGCPGTTIDAKTGTVKTKATDFGSAVIKATSADGTKSNTYVLYIGHYTLASKIQLSNSSLTLWAGESAASLSETVKDAYGSTLSDVSVEWISSAPAVATVSTSGFVSALSRGKATITCRAMDGSGVKATCTVTVKQAPNDIHVTGSEEVVPGKAYTYKAVLSPAKLDKKVVAWSCETESGDPLPISSSGKLTVPSTLPAGTVLYVTATAETGTGYTLGYSKKVTVQNATKNLALECGFWGAKTDSKGVLKSVMMYSVETEYWGDPDETKGWTDASAWLDARITDAYGATTYNNSRVTWTSSKPSVATVTDDGYVQAVKAGKTTITAKAKDGSGKSASVTVNVINPVSGITIKSSSALKDEHTKFLTLGKTVTNKAVFYDETLGKATQTKVSWSYDISAYDSDDNEVDWLVDLIYQKKWITFNRSNGKLTAKNNKEFASYVSQYSVIVSVYADATDMTGTWTYLDYLVVNPLKKIYFWGYNYETVNGNGYKYKSFSKPKTSCTITLPKHSKEDPYVIEPWIDVDYAGGSGSLQAVSSNPAVAGALGAGTIITTGKSGTAKITIKSASDGKTKAVITIKVK